MVIHAFQTLAFVQFQKTQADEVVRPAQLPCRFRAATCAPTRQTSRGRSRCRLPGAATRSCSARLSYRSFHFQTVWSAAQSPLAPGRQQRPLAELEHGSHLPVTARLALQPADFGLAEKKTLKSAHFQAIQSLERVDKISRRRSSFSDPH